MTFSFMRRSWYSRLINLCLVVTFIVTMVITPRASFAQEGVMGLPQPGTMVNLSSAYVPLMITGLSVHPENPLLMDFIVSTGNSGLDAAGVKKGSDRLIKYFLACLTIPENNQWVNLSPYEKDRIVPDDLGQTVLGQDMLAQDYILKQLTASLIYPEKNLGKNFWDKVYARASQMYGTTKIPVNTFNKVWILPDTAKVYEHNNTVFVVKSHLTVMLDEDYLSMQKHVGSTQGQAPNSNNLGSKVIREIILPAIEKEVNYGQNFAQLRQIYNSMILAFWYKKNLKQALLNQVYTDRSKVNGVNVDDPAIKERIYQQYLQAYKKGAFNYIKEEIDQNNQQVIPRKYFSGGIGTVTKEEAASPSEAMLALENKQAGDENYKATVGLSGSTQEVLNANIATVRRQMAEYAANSERSRQSLLEALGAVRRSSGNPASQAMTTWNVEKDFTHGGYRTLSFKRGDEKHLVLFQRGELRSFYGAQAVIDGNVFHLTFPNYLFDASSQDILGYLMGGVTAHSVEYSLNSFKSNLDERGLGDHPRINIRFRRGGEIKDVLFLNFDSDGINYRPSNLSAPIHVGSVSIHSIVVIAPFDAAMTTAEEYKQGFQGAKNFQEFYAVESKLGDFIKHSPNSEGLLEFVITMLNFAVQESANGNKENRHSYYELAHGLSTRIVGIENRGSEVWVEAWSKGNGSISWSKWTDDLARDIAGDSIQRHQAGVSKSVSPTMTGTPGGIKVEDVLARGETLGHLIYQFDHKMITLAEARERLRNLAVNLNNDHFDATHLDGTPESKSAFDELSIRMLAYARKVAQQWTEESEVKTLADKLFQELKRTNGQKTSATVSGAAEILAFGETLGHLIYQFDHKMITLAKAYEQLRSFIVNFDATTLDGTPEAREAFSTVSNKISVFARKVADQRAITDPNILSLVEHRVLELVAAPMQTSPAMTAAEIRQNFDARLDGIMTQHQASRDISKTAEALMQFSDDFNYVVLDGTAEAQKAFNDILVKKSIFARTIAVDWVSKTDKNSPEYNEFISLVLQNGFSSIEAFGKRMVDSGVAKKSSMEGAIKVTKILLPEWLDAKNNVPQYIIAGAIRGLLEGRSEDILYDYGKDWRMFGTAGIRNQAVQSSFGAIADLELSEFAQGPHAAILTGPNLMNVMTIIQQQQAIVNVYLEIQNAARAGTLEQLIKEKNLDRRFVEDVVNNNKVSIAYDSRLNGKYFAHMLAAGFLEAGVDIDLFDRPSGVPAVIYAGAENPDKRSAMGILMSASHSEANYNGFKAFLMVYRSQVDTAGKNMVVGQRPAIVGEPGKGVVVVPYKMRSELGTMSLEDFDKIFAEHARVEPGHGRLKWISDEKFNPTTNPAGADIDSQFFNRYYQHIEDLSPAKQLGLSESEQASFVAEKKAMNTFYTAFMGGGAVNAQNFPGFLRRMGYAKVFINNNQTLQHNGSFSGFNKPGGLFGMPDPGVTQGWIVNLVEFLQQEAGEKLDNDALIEKAIDLINSFTVGLATDPDIDRGGILLPMGGMQGGNLKSPLISAVEEKLHSLNVPQDRIERVKQALSARLDDFLLLTANDAWTFMVYHKLRMMANAGKMSKDKLYVIEKSHVTTDALSFVAESFRAQGYHVYTLDTYVGFTELAKKSRDLYKIAQLGWLIHQHLALGDLTTTRRDTLKSLYAQLLELNDELKRNVMYERQGIPLIDEAINKLGDFLNNGQGVLAEVMPLLSIVAHMEIPMGVEESNGYGEFGAFVPNENLRPLETEEGYTNGVITQDQITRNTTIEWKDFNQKMRDLELAVAIGKTEMHTPLGVIPIIPTEIRLTRPLEEIIKKLGGEVDPKLSNVLQQAFNPIGSMEREHISEKDGSLADYEFADFLALGKALEKKSPMQMYLDVFRAIGAVGTDNRFLQYVGLTGEDKKLGAMEWFEKTMAVRLKQAVDTGKEVTLFNGKYKVKDVQVYRDAKYDVFGIGFPEEGVRLILESQDGSKMFVTYRPSGTGANNRTYSWVFGPQTYKGKQISEMSYEELNNYRVNVVANLNELANDFFGIQDKPTGYAQLDREHFHGLMSALGELSFDQYDSVLPKFMDQPELTTSFTLPDEIALRSQAEDFGRALRPFTDPKKGVVNTESAEYQSLSAHNRQLWTNVLAGVRQYPLDKWVEVRINGHLISAVPKAYAIGWQTSMVDYLAQLIKESSASIEAAKITSNDPEVLALIARRYGKDLGAKVSFVNAAMSTPEEDDQMRRGEVDEESEGFVPENGLNGRHGWAPAYDVGYSDLTPEDSGSNPAMIGDWDEAPEPSLGDKLVSGGLLAGGFLSLVALFVVLKSGANAGIAGTMDKHQDAVNKGKMQSNEAWSIYSAHTGELLSDIANYTGVDLVRLHTVNGIAPQETRVPTGGQDLMIPDRRQISFNLYLYGREGMRRSQICQVLFNDPNDKRGIEYSGYFLDKDRYLQYLTGKLTDGGSIPLRADDSIALTFYIDPNKESQSEIEGRWDKYLQEDHAQTATGGIDLASKHLKMESSGDKVNITFDPAMIAQFKRGDFSGVKIQILEVVPVSLMLLLGLKE